MLEVKNITKSFGDFHALEGVSFKLKEGELVTLLGTNGCGKTTTIKITVGFEEETTGNILYNGKRMPQELRSRIIGWAPQDDSFYGNLTLDENMIYFGNINGINIKDAKKRSTELLELLQLNHKRDALAKSLSGGMKRRLNMAIALMHKPKILILDEPEAGVDPMSRVTLWEVVNKVKKQGTTILLVTHNLLETEYLSDRILIMDAGSVVYEGTPKQLKNKTNKKNIEEAFKKIVEKKGKPEEKKAYHEEIKAEPEEKKAEPEEIKAEPEVEKVKSKGEKVKSKEKNKNHKKKNSKIKNKAEKDGENK